jgi:hypothetical protein
MWEQNSVGRFENIDELPVLEFVHSVTEAGVIQRAVSVAGRWQAKQRSHEAVPQRSIRYSQNLTGTAWMWARSTSRQKKCPREAFGSHVGELSPINGKGESLFHSSHQQGSADACFV